MYLEENCTFHVYNRSNDLIFLNRDNYIYFLKKVRESILPYAHILSYCLMPNHYHFIIKIKPEGAMFYENKKIDQMQYIARGFGTLQSSYTQALNKQIKRQGSLFVHKVKAKKLTHAENDYAINCFMYIHQNPIVAGLVEKIEDWEFSSFPDFIGIRKGTLVNIQLSIETFQLDRKFIYEQTYKLLIDKVDEDFL